MVMERQYCEIVYLVPANVETAAWDDYLWNADAICFPKKRIKFLVNGKTLGTPRFASAVGYFGPRKMKFYEAFSDFGKVVFP
jgi:hypothetical protein